MRVHEKHKNLYIFFFGFLRSLQSRVLKMARSLMLSFTALLQLMVLGQLLLGAFARAASVELPSKPHLKHRNPGPAAEPVDAVANSSVQHFFVTGDGSQIIPIDSP